MGRPFCGCGSKEKKGWWDDEVKHAVKVRKEASREHRFYKEMAVAFPGLP